MVTLVLVLWVVSATVALLAAVNVPSRVSLLALAFALFVAGEVLLLGPRLG